MSDAVRNENTNKYPIDIKWVQSLFRVGFTYNDYKTWPGDVHAEIIDGVVYLMAAPSERHAYIQSNISRQLGNFLDDKTCAVYTAKFGVRLAYEDSGLDQTTVEPDVFVVCDESIVFDKSECQGVPDFIIEIVSKSESDKDLNIKRQRYERAGVKEYWVIELKHLHIFTLIDGEYIETVKEITKDLKQSISCLGGCIIDFQLIANRYAGTENY